MAEARIIREIETRTVRKVSIEEVEEALRDQLDLHVQDDIKFEWLSAGPGGCPQLLGVDIIHVERTTERGA